MDKKKKDNEAPEVELESQEESSQSPDAQGVNPLDECLQQVAQWKDKYMRAVADAQNTQRRAAKDRELFTFQVQADFLHGLLTVVDDVDRALANAPHDDKEAQAWLEGFELIQKKLYTFLDGYGVKEIDAAPGMTFDPEKHEALAHVPSEAYESEKIVEVLQKGFVLKDSILRPAKVSVAQ